MESLIGVKGLKIKGEKNKVSTYELYIVCKVLMQSFLHKNKHVHGIVDVIVFIERYYWFRDIQCKIQYKWSTKSGMDKFYI